MCLHQSAKTALHLAAEHGHFEVVEFLIGMGCTHGLKDKVVTQKQGKRLVRMTKMKHEHHLHV